MSNYQKKTTYTNWDNQEFTLGDRDLSDKNFTLDISCSSAIYFQNINDVHEFCELLKREAADFYETE